MSYLLEDNSDTGNVRMPIAPDGAAIWGEDGAMGPAAISRPACEKTISLNHVPPHHYRHVTERN